MQAQEHSSQWTQFPVSFDQFEDEGRADQPTLALNAASRVMIVAVWSWSLIETYWELRFDLNSLQTGIVVISKLVLSAFALAALFGSSAALIALAFSCIASIVVIGVTLPEMFSIARAFFYLSLIEVAAKVTLIVTIACHYVSDHFEDDVSQVWPFR